jgi:hypothetical protein
VPQSTVNAKQDDELENIATFALKRLGEKEETEYLKASSQKLQELGHHLIKLTTSDSFKKVAIINLTHIHKLSHIRNCLLINHVAS